MLLPPTIVWWWANVKTEDYIQAAVCDCFLNQVATQRMQTTRIRFLTFRFVEP